MNLRPAFVQTYLSILLLSVPILSGCAVGPVDRAPASVTEAPPKKVVIFYSSIGMGHLSAARSIEKNIVAREPGVAVVLKDIRDFAPKFRDKFEEKAFWYLVKNHPNVFDAMYRSAMERGNRVPSLSQAPQMYNPDKVLEFIQKENADVVLTTHYGSAQVVGDLRDQQRLGDIRTGWLHTDYVEGYFPRISKRMDMSFLPHRGLEEIWERAGVPRERFATTGMPLNPSLFSPVDRDAFMKAKGLDPNVKTLVLASGGEGVGDFPAIVKSIAAEVKGPFQIVAVCAKNESHFKNLNALKSRLPPEIKLEVLGFTPSDDLLNYIKVADIYVTKSGGLSPTEGFAIMKPMLLLDVYGGHEHDNLIFFEKLGMASGIKDQRQTGKDVVALLADPARQTRMTDAQAKFREALDIGKVTDFVFSGKNAYEMAAADFGKEGGSAARLTKEQLARLAFDSPDDIEILLSYAKNPRNIAFDRTENPFGHIAIKVGDDVYTVNHIAKAGVDQRFLAKVSLHDYLFSTAHYDIHSEEQSTTGLAYARDVIGVRVSGLSDEQKKGMFAEIDRLEEGWANGSIVYANKGNNCADVTEQILKAGGIHAGKEYGPKGKVTLPLDVFDRYLTKLQRVRGLEVELVNYTRIPDSLSRYRYSKFPVSVYQLRRSLVNMLVPGRLDPLETLATKRITAYAGDRNIHYENIDQTSTGENRVTKEKNRASFGERLKAIQAREVEIETAREKAKADGLTGGELQKKMDEVMRSIPAEERRLVGSSQESQLPEESRRKLAEVRTWIAATDRRQIEIHSALDRLVVDELDLLADEAMAVKTEAALRLSKRFGLKVSAPFTRLAREIDDEYTKYIAAKNLYGQSKDQRRISAYRDLFAKLREFHAKVESMYESETVTAKKSVLRSIADSFSRIFSSIRQVAALSGDILRVLRVVLFPPSFDRLFGSVETDLKSLPLTKAIRRFARSAARSEKVVVEIKGKERIPVLKDAKTINIYAPTHRQPMNDLFVMGELIPDDALIFTVPEYFAPKPLAKALAKKDGFVAVGFGRDPIASAMAQVKAGKSQNLLIYPEGSVSIGLQETRPPRTKFTTGLIKELRSQGYRVNIIPVVYGNSATPLTQNGVTSSVLSAEILAPITDSRVSLLAGTDDETLGRHIRALWMENLPTSDRELSGKLRVDIARWEHEAFLYGTPEWRAKNCGGLFSAP